MTSIHTSKTVSPKMNKFLDSVGFIRFLTLKIVKYNIKMPFMGYTLLFAIITVLEKN